MGKGTPRGVPFNPCQSVNVHSQVKQKPEVMKKVKPCGLLWMSPALRCALESPMCRSYPLNPGMNYLLRVLSSKKP